MAPPALPHRLFDRLFAHVMKKALLLLLAITYPVIAHVAAMDGSDAWTLTSLVVLATAVMLPGLARGSLLAWIAVVPVVVGTVLLARAGSAGILLFLPPVAFNFLIAWMFGRTLVRGRTPLIEQLIRLMHPPDDVLEPAIFRYARRLTLAWCVLLAALGTINLVLALCVVPNGMLQALGVTPFVQVARETASLFANLLNYLIIAGFFTVEYSYRRWRFPAQPYRNMLDFMRQAAAVGPRVFGRGEGK